MKKHFISLSILISSLIFYGCASSGIHTSGSLTQVELSSANYSIVATSVRGRASAEYLFGGSFGAGMYNQTLALIPLTKDRALYNLAMTDLWKKFEEKNGNVTGRKLALVNLRYDTEALNLFFYTKPTVSIVADVIEFNNQ